MVLIDQLLGNFLIFGFVGWLAMRAFTNEDNLSGVVILAAILAFAAPIFGTSLSAEPVTMVALAVLVFGVAQYALRMDYVQTFSLVALIWVFGVFLMSMTF